MNRILKQQMKRLVKQEEKMLNRQELPVLKSTITPVIEKIQGNIPAKLKTILDVAFYKGFRLVFEKGTGFIEKTYNKDKILFEYDINNYAIDKKLSNKYIAKLDMKSKQTKLLNSSFSVLEGGVLGFLGIGLPDIPLFLSVIIKTIYEEALSYGFNYNSPEERTYILLLICGAVTKDDLQKEYDKELNQLVEKIDKNIVVEIDFNNQIKKTANTLLEALLVAKFIQGIPIIGAVGGVVNYSILNRIAKYAGIKYKKRYLQRKFSEKDFE